MAKLKAVAFKPRRDAIDSRELSDIHDELNTVQSTLMCASFALGKAQDVDDHEMAAKGERRTPENARSSDSVSLDQIGITGKESQRFQESARAPKDQVEHTLKNGRETQTPVTSAWISGRLRQNANRSSLKQPVIPCPRRHQGRRRPLSPRLAE